MKHLAFSFILTALLFCSCGICVAQHIPQVPDYHDATMWITVDGDSTGMGADVFYVVSTWEEDWKTADSTVCHYAEVWNPIHREHMASEINKAAQGETDTGVTICYNTVKDVKYIKPVVAATCIGINPVNWRTDATPAILHDTITVTLSPEYHVLVVSGYSGSEYPAYKDFINVGDIHSCEPWLYSECLQRNIKVRAKEWRKFHQPTVTRIRERGKLLLGTTGDYRPLSYRETDGNYWGFGIEMAEKIAERIGVSIEYVQTSWPTLTADVLTEPQTFDLAIGGITITDVRKETMLMSDGYLTNGKTILCRATDADRYQSLADIDKPEVRVMVNPGGLNEKFANENLTHATIIVYQKNEEIPHQVAEGNADVMITEITEAPWYVQNDPRLAAPLLNAPFTHGEIGVLMRKGQDDLLQVVNNSIRQMKSDGTLRSLHEKYGLVYAY